MSATRAIARDKCAHCILMRLFSADCNIDYFSSTALVSWGASGAPVLASNGKAVAVHCGNTACPAASLHLSLHPVVYALRCLQSGLPVRRGCVQTVLRRVSVPDSQELALELEKAMETTLELQKFWSLIQARRFLVVDQALPKGPADGQLEPGTVVLGIAGQPCPAFEVWEDCLNMHAGRTVECEVWMSGAYKRLSLQVQDMHESSPHEFLEVGGGVLHQLSFQQGECHFAGTCAIAVSVIVTCAHLPILRCARHAILHPARHYQMPLRQVYIAAAPHMFEREGIKHHSVLLAIADREVATLRDVQEALAATGQGETVLITYMSLKDK